MSYGAKSILEYQQEIHAIAVENGWWEDPNRNILESLMLVVSEISEAAEAYREHRMDFYFENDGKPEGFFVELADAMIRILDLAEKHGVEMGMIMNQKIVYNKMRPYRHGNKNA